MTRDLSRLFRPKSIAVVGGGAWCANIVEQCHKIGFSGPVWPVHPTRDTLVGLKAYSSVTALPEPPDATFIGVNRNATLDVVQDLRAQGAGGAVCFASGFLEAQNELGDGAALQDALLAAAGDMPIIGPNCYGFVNYVDCAALWPDQHGGLPVDSGVAIITQSSNIAINLSMQRRALPIAYLMTVGNQAQIGMSEMASSLLDDPRVTAIGLHVEGIDDLRGFEDFARKAHAVGKPVVVLKVGKSDQARAATVSHTASLAGSDAGATALFARFGVGQVTSLSGMIETLKLLHVVGPLSSNRIASMSCSGGEASLMADSALGAGLEYPALDAAQSEALRAALGPKVALANPLDYHTYIWNDIPAMTATFAAMMEGDLALGCVVVDYPRSDRCDPGAWDCVLEAAAAAQQNSGRKVALLGSLSDAMPEEVAEAAMAKGVMAFCGMDEALQAMQVAASIGQAEVGEAPLCLPRLSAGDVRVLTEAEAKSALAAFGVPIPRANTASTADDAAKVAAGFSGPVVLKGQGIAHKTEAGAVVLNLRDPQEVHRAADAMDATGFLIEEMVQGTLVEMLVGVVKDPVHGYVLTLAAGGTLTELLQDSVSLLVPASRDAIKSGLQGLKIAKLLSGYRGAAPVDVEKLVDVVMAVQDYVIANHPEEVEINPVMCGPDFAIAADALIKIGENDD